MTPPGSPPVAASLSVESTPNPNVVAAPTLDDQPRSESAVHQGPDAPDLTRLQNLERARDLFQDFIDRAKGRDDFAEPIQLARERVADIDAEIDFVRQGIAERLLERLSDEN